LKTGYWRERNLEVDFVLRQGQRAIAIEVKSGRGKGALTGLAAFSRQFNAPAGFVVGSGGIPLDIFLTTPPEAWVT
jgi:tRNA(Met) C34 N-acetyltransferase TmcA